MTSPPVDDSDALRDVMRRAEVLFLDFDGPVCDLFAGVPASVVADQLCVVLADSGHNDLPPDVEKSSDPFDVLNYAAKLGQAEADHVNAAFTAHEVEAIATAAPTPGAHDLIRKWSRTGRRLAIVSNNSRSAVDAYLDLHRLRQQVSFVSARVSADPALLKPSPHLVEAALASLVVRSSEVVFIGDSLSDLIAARDATVTFVGYANRAYKIESFTHQLALTTTDLTRVLSVG